MGTASPREVFEHLKKNCSREELVVIGKSIDKVLAAMENLGEKGNSKH